MSLYVDLAELKLDYSIIMEVKIWQKYLINKNLL